jgi:hypothetical protein
MDSSLHISALAAFDLPHIPKPKILAVEIDSPLGFFHEWSFFCEACQSQPAFPAASALLVLSFVRSFFLFSLLPSSILPLSANVLFLVCLLWLGLPSRAHGRRHHPFALPDQFPLSSS